MSFLWSLKLSTSTFLTYIIIINMSNLRTVHKYYEKKIRK